MTDTKVKKLHSHGLTVLYKHFGATLGTSKNWEMVDTNYEQLWPSFKSTVRYFKSTVKVKKCGICPLYTKKKDDNNACAGDYSGSVRFSKNGIEEPSGSNVAWKEEAL